MDRERCWGRLVRVVVGPGLVAGLLTGCPSAHEADGGMDGAIDAGPPDARVELWVDGDRRLVELTDAEWQNLCEWRASLFESPAYYCNGATYLGPDAGPCADCDFYDWSLEECFYVDDDPVRTGEVDFWRSQLADCPLTVAMRVACIEDAASVRCILASFPSSCSALVCPDEPSDGSGPDPGQ